MSASPLLACPQRYSSYRAAAQAIRSRGVSVSSPIRPVREPGRNVRPSGIARPRRFGRRPARKSHLILARREPGLALEQLSKCAEVSVADALADRLKADGSRLQQLFGHFDAQVLQIREWREADCLLEPPVERSFAHGERVGELAQP